MVDRSPRFVAKTLDTLVEFPSTRRVVLTRPAERSCRRTVVGQHAQVTPGRTRHRSLHDARPLGAGGGR